MADYTVFACTLIISAAIGLYYAIKDRKKNTTDEYLLAGRGMHPAPVAMSLVSTFISAITILGTPSEVYVHSTMYWWLCAGLFICATGSACIFVPIFYNLGITSVFEVRYSRIFAASFKSRDPLNKKIQPQDICDQNSSRAVRLGSTLFTDIMSIIMSTTSVGCDQNMHPARKRRLI